jgi:raffinose/stachyose/melibiose transport system permease protein
MNSVEIPMKQINTVLKYSLLIVLAILMSSPLFTTILGSVRTTGEFMSAPLALPTNGILWENYTDILLGDSFWNSLRNSLIITLTSTALTVVLSSMIAFIFARVPFYGDQLFFNILTIGLLFPLIIAILPVFIQLRQLGLINSHWGVILPLVTFSLPSSVVILRGFFTSIPRELEDASYIDGATTIGFFRHILLPMARPSIAAVGTLTAIASWNDYFLALLVLTDSAKWPLPLGIMQFQGQYGADWARVMAYVTILMVPAILFYLLAERYIITGLTGGELKG